MSFKGRAGGTRIGIAAEKGQRGEERIEATEREQEEIEIVVTAALR